MIFPPSANRPVNLFVDACAAFPSSTIDELRFALTFRGFEPQPAFRRSICNIPAQRTTSSRTGR
jgi:hypothetical protein